MNALIRAIHKEFLKLSTTNRFFSEYTEKNLQESEGHAQIYYNRTDDTSMAQMPDHVLICYIEIQHTNGFKYWNVFENTPACRFPAQHRKIYGQVVIGSDPKLGELVKRIVINKCTQQKSGKLPEPPAQHGWTKPFPAESNLQR